MELKKCPFCGSTYIRISDYLSQADCKKVYFVICDCCHAQGPSNKKEIKAVESWNTRHEGEI